MGKPCLCNEKRAFGKTMSKGSTLCAQHFPLYTTRNKPFKTFSMVYGFGFHMVLKQLFLTICIIIIMLIMMKLSQSIYLHYAFWDKSEFIPDLMNRA